MDILGFGYRKCQLPWLRAEERTQFLYVLTTNRQTDANSSCIFSSDQRRDT